VTLPVVRRRGVAENQQLHLKDISTVSSQSVLSSELSYATDYSIGAGPGLASRRALPTLDFGLWTLDFSIRRMTVIDVLGTPLLVTDYAGLSEQCQQWAREQHCV